MHVCSAFKTSKLVNLKLIVRYCYCSLFQNTYYTALKAADPLHWKDRDLDPEIMYSSSGGMPHGRLAIGDGAIKKAVVVAKARENDTRPSNSISYHCLLKENAQLKKRCKNNFVLSKHVQVLLIFYTDLLWLHYGSCWCFAHRFHHLLHCRGFMASWDGKYPKIFLPTKMSWWMAVIWYVRHDTQTLYETNLSLF